MNLKVKIFRLAGGFLAGFFIAVFLFTNHSSVYAVSPDNKTAVSVFVRVGCTHCKDEEEFLTQLAKERNDFDTRYYRLENQNDREIWARLTTKLGIAKVTPITVIGVKYLVGFGTPNTTGRELINLFRMHKITILLQI